MSKVKCLCNVRESVMLAPGVFSLWIDAPEIAESAAPGQFVSIYTKSEARLLPRPISICEINRGEKMMRFVYRVVGEGTEEFSKLSSGDKIEVLGPLGNGFPIPEKKAILIGGGIGIPPMLALAKACKERPTVVLGYRDATLFLKEEFDKVADVVIATDDGSVGTHGTVIDAMKEKKSYGRCYLCLWSNANAPRSKGIRSGKRNRNVCIHGRANGLWNRCLSWLCMPVNRGRFPF